MNSRSRGLSSSVETRGRPEKNGGGPAKTYLPEIAVTVAMFFYGISFIATKSALSSYGPITIITVRNIISGGLLLSILLHRRGRAALPTKEELFPLFLIALFQPFIYFICETFGISRVEASLASIIIATIPVFTPVIAGFFYSERLTLFNYLGLVFSFLGVFIIVMINNMDLGAVGKDIDLLGILLLFGAVFAAVFYTILVKRVSSRHTPLSITALQNCIGALLLIPLFALTEASAAFTVPFDAAAGLNILFLAVFPSSISFLFMNYGIRTIGPSRTNAFANLVPLVTAVFSFLLLGESFSPAKIAGMLIILTGVIMAQRGGRQLAEGVEEFGG